MDIVSYLIVVFLYGISLEGIHLVSKRGAWIFMLIVTMAIALSYPNFIGEISYFVFGAQRVASKGQRKK